MYATYSAHSDSKVQPDADFIKVVNKHLVSEDPKVALRALRAARTAITGKSANKELVDAVVSLKQKYADGPGRYALIDTLRVVSFDSRSEPVISVFVDSLNSKDAYVLSYALQALHRSTRSVKDTAAVNAKALSLAKHEDPGVRGRAIELLGTTGKGDPAALAAVLAALEDPHAYVRSEAAESSARLRHAPAIHPLMKLVAQKEPNSYEITGFKQLDGSEGRLRHDGSAWGFVQDAAMNAVRSLSSGGLKLERLEPKNLAEGLAKNATATQEWYAKNKASFQTK
jgi:HEAT repeat protein